MAIDNQPQKPPAETSLLRLGAIVGAIMILIGAVAWFFPKVKPEVPPDPAGKISTVAIERDVAFETYLERNNEPAPAGFTCVELKSDGMLIKPLVELTGLKDQIVQLRWSMYSADSDRMVPSDWYPAGLPLSLPEYIPTHQQDTWVFDHWLPYPRANGKFFVRLELVAQDNARFKSLGYGDTKPFDVALLPECAGPPPTVPFPPDEQLLNWQEFP